MDELRRGLEGETPEVWQAVERRVLLRRYEADGDEEVFRQALERYEAALAAGESGAELLRELGYLWESRGVFSLRRAVGLYERAVEAEPDAPEPRQQLIQARARLLQAAEVLEEQRGRAASRHDDPVAQRLLLHACLAAGAHDEAEDVLRRARERFPDDPSFVLAEASLLEATGRLDEALAANARLAELDPEHADPLYARALLLTKLGRRDEAAAAWRELIAWLDERGFDIEAGWPRRELERLLAEPPR